MPRRGFTLIEVLVVIGVIAVLIGLIFPALGQARQTARRAKCLANLKGIGVGFQLYLNESKGLFPLVRPFHDGGGNKNDPSLLELLEAYVEAPTPRRGEDGYWIVSDPYRCPSDIASDDADANFEPLWRTAGISYEYFPGALMFGAELFGMPWERTQHAVSRAYESRAWPVLMDPLTTSWHALRAGGPARNALLFPDMRADWAIEISDDDYRDVFEEMFR